jgi:hypothetical protein
MTEHELMRWGGRERCQRCGEIAPEGPCTERTWQSGTFQLRHIAGPSDQLAGGQTCLRCGDPIPFRMPEGWEYVLTDQRDAGGFSWSGRYTHPDEDAPWCTTL